jgi:hypothetical protein
VFAKRLKPLTRKARKSPWRGTVPSGCSIIAYLRWKPTNPVGRAAMIQILCSHLSKGANHHNTTLATFIYILSWIPCKGTVLSDSGMGLQRNCGTGSRGPWSGILLYVHFLSLTGEGNPCTVPFPGPHLSGTLHAGMRSTTIAAVTEGRSTRSRTPRSCRPGLLLFLELGAHNTETVGAVAVVRVVVVGPVGKSGDVLAVEP